MTRALHSREGFALLAVLWMLGGGAALGVLMMLAARDAQGVATNRVGLARARWMAEGCVERARAAVDESIAQDMISDSAWAHLDRIVRESAVTRGCTLTITPAGTTLDVNTASESQLLRLFIESGIPTVAADSMVEAILDWRDTDDDPRGSGAERRWYDAAGREPPRNGDIGSVNEIDEIRGLERLTRDVPLLGVESGRVLLSHAARPVLATLPGMTPPVLAEIDRRRAEGDSVLDVLQIAAFVDSTTREQLLLNSATLAGLATALPEAWIIAASTSEGRPSVTTRLELLVVRSGRRLAVMRRRSDM